MWEILSGRKARKQASSTGENSDATESASPLVSSRKVKSQTQLRSIGATSIAFKDLEISATIDEHEEEAHEDAPTLESSEDSLSRSSINASEKDEGSPRINRRQGAKKWKVVKHVLIMVGLPGRGKTFLCNKLKCYLNWLGHNTRHINVGQFRRKQKDEKEVQAASFFDPNNQEGIEARNKALEAALQEVHDYLATETGQVVIFDATNTTESRRQKLVTEFHGRYQYLFIESICNDEAVLERNYRFKTKWSPDYKGVDPDAAFKDFKERVKKYEAVYEPLSNRNVHYIKLTDMVTGRGWMDVNRISGYIPGKIVFFLMQICKVGMTQTRKIWLTRHGESFFNERGLIGGDSELSANGEQVRVIPTLPISPLLTPPNTS
jgi:predicted kinase